MSMAKVFIYALCDPDTNQVRYVGKAANPQKRLKRHLGFFEPKPTHKQNWIKSLIANGKSPILKILEEVEDSEWEESERKWITYYRDSGANLTNTTDGGEGGKTLTADTLSQEERTRRSERGRSFFKKMWAESKAHGRGEL